MVFGFVGLICGSARGQTAENIIKLKKSGNCKGCFLEKASLEGANLEGADLKGLNPKKANLKGTNLEFDDKNFYRLSVGKADRGKDKIKGAKNQKKVEGAQKTTKVSQKDLVRVCKRKAEAQFRKCAKGSTGGNVGGNFLAHQGLQKAAQKRYARLRQPTMTM